MRMGVALTYDLVNQAIFLPAGGSGRLRQELVDVLEIEPGQRVLELGCGTGQVTERLVAAGAQVLAVDALPEMLAATRRRAPTTAVIHGDILDVPIETGFDAVVLSFVLHNLDTSGRRRLLARSADALRQGGRVCDPRLGNPGGTLASTSLAALPEGARAITDRSRGR
jgi:ubiquinone/menaquinone biosynthesis C-methylase UbiE